MFNRSYNWILLDALHCIAIECTLFRFGTTSIRVAYDEKRPLCCNDIMAISSIDQIAKFRPGICCVVIGGICWTCIDPTKNEEPVFVNQVGVVRDLAAERVSCPRFPFRGRQIQRFQISMLRQPTSKCVSMS